MRECRAVRRRRAQRVYYRPGLFESMKLGWMQYLSLAFLVYWVLSWMWGVMVRSGVVTTRVHNPLAAVSKAHQY